MSAPESSLPVAGTVVVLRAADPGFELLLMRRPDRGSFAGAWVFPGGKVEPGDVREGDDEAEDARRAAIRETREEVGLAVDDLVPLSQWQPPLEAPTRIRTWFFLAEASDEEPSPSAEEVAEIGSLTQTAMRVLTESARAHGFNIGMNQGRIAGAGIADHLHQHIVPRWALDANFFPIIAGTKALPRLLGDVRRDIADAWPK